eukprot:10964367-Lingulodinium_polyedra.AAC.1
MAPVVNQRQQLNRAVSQPVAMVTVAGQFASAKMCAHNPLECNWGQWPNLIIQPPEIWPQTVRGVGDL